MILLLDNFDSFTYNIYQMVGVMDPDIRVIRNDACSLADIRRLRPTHIILSPGPGYPQSAGIMLSVIRAFHDSVPILGICLGHQGIAQAFGGHIIQAPAPVHGKQDRVILNQPCPLFAACPAEMTVGRYHSLIIEKSTLPDCLEITAETSRDHLIMAIRHKFLPLFGLQFHPESILTEHGQNIMRAFLQIRQPVIYDRARRPRCGMPGNIVPVRVTGPSDG